MSFFQELRRRNVFKVATVYIVTSWLVIQVGSIVMPAFDAPDWVMKTLIVLLSFGFLIALILAWAFEVTHDGVKRDFSIPFKESGIGNSGRKLNFIIVGLLIANLGYFIYQSRVNTQSTETHATESRLTDDANNKSESLSEVVGSIPTSIAVLPFVNMSSDPEQEYFSDGISEEILNVLAKIPNLHVTSRSSAFAFKGDKINITEVAAKLGVKHVLEGSVRKSGTTVRITAQLISANTDKHLWSETYDRELDDIFKVQDEISGAIVDSLTKTLGIDLVKTASTAQVINPEAYDYYLQGLRGLRVQTFDSLRNAVIAFESAIKIAPDYLPARIKLAEVFISQFRTGSRSDREILNTADDIIKQVLDINPDSADAYLVKAFIAMANYQQDLAKQYAKKAYQLNPNNADIITLYIVAHMYDDAMSEQKARTLFNEAQHLDPLNANIPYNYGQYLSVQLQSHSEAEKLLKRAISINPMNADYPAALSWFYSNNLGNLIDAIKQTKIAFKLDNNNPWYPELLSAYYLSLGDTQKAIEYANKISALNGNNFYAIYAKVNALIYGEQDDKALQLLRDSFNNPDTVDRANSKVTSIERAVFILLKNNKLTEAEVLINQYFPEVSSLIDAPMPASINEIGREIFIMSTVYQAQGKTEKAQKLAKRMSLMNEAFFSRGNKPIASSEYILLAEISAVQNNNDKAVTYLETAIDNGYLMDWRTLITQSPFFLTLHKHPKYVALIKRLEAEVQRQRGQLNNEQKAT